MKLDVPYKFMLGIKCICYRPLECMRGASTCTDLWFAVTVPKALNLAVVQLQLACVCCAFGIDLHIVCTHLQSHSAAKEGE